MIILTKDSQEITLRPLDIAAKAVIQLRNSSSEIVHVTHPYQAVQWNTVFSYVSKVLDIRLVPFSEWLVELERYEGRQSAEENHALRLLDYYRMVAKVEVDNPSLEAAGMVRFATDVSKKESSVLGYPNMRCVDASEVQKWLKYWRSIGLLSF